MDTQLNDGAEYGSLPFDRFAVVSAMDTLERIWWYWLQEQERWDYSESPERDQDQWNALAQSWLTMTHQERQVSRLHTHPHKDPLWSYDQPRLPEIPCWSKN